MDDFVKNFDSLLNGKEIPDNIKEMLNSFIQNSNSTNETSNNSSNEASSPNNDFANIDMETILKIQKIIKTMNSEQSDSRSNLLRSLKPYLNPNRQKKVDQYIQLLNMEKVLELFNNGGDKNGL